MRSGVRGPRKRGREGTRRVFQPATVDACSGQAVTLFLGLAIGSTMVGSEFLKPSTLAILVLGIVAFAVDGVAGVLFAKLLNLLSGGRVNPLVGAAGISAFPMAARVVQKVAQEEDFENFLLMHAMGANAAGQVASVVAGGVLLALMGAGGH